MSKMQVCLTCNHENTAAASHCSRCYAPLSVEETAPLSPTLVEEIYQDYRDQRGDLQPGMIAMYFVGKAHACTIAIDGSLTLGRQTSNRGDGTLDLTDYHGRLLGVSRLHAVMHCADGGYTITDLDSMNGTWVSRIRLASNKPHRLHDGDQVRLGDLSFFVFLPA